MSGEQAGPSKDTEQVATKCFECGRELSSYEIKNGLDACYPDCVLKNPVQEGLFYGL